MLDFQPLSISRPLSSFEEGFVTTTTRLPSLRQPSGLLPDCYTTHTQPHNQLDQSWCSVEPGALLATKLPSPERSSTPEITQRMLQLAAHRNTTFEPTTSYEPPTAGLQGTAPLCPFPLLVPPSCARSLDHIAHPLTALSNSPAWPVPVHLLTHLSQSNSIHCTQASFAPTPAVRSTNAPSSLTSLPVPPPLVEPPSSVA